MIEEVEIRESLPRDIASIETLYQDAFPDEDLVPLVRELLKEEHGVLSLVGLIDRALAGHIIFTTCRIAESSDKVSLLGPLAVARVRQRQGIGSALVREGLRRQENTGAVQVFVLGDPAYYERVGFEPETDVTPPYALPDDWRGAWQSISLKNTEPPCRGQLSVPQPWLQPALWAP